MLRAALILVLGVAALLVQQSKAFAQAAEASEPPILGLVLEADLGVAPAVVDGLVVDEKDGHFGPYGAAFIGVRVWRFDLGPRITGTLNFDGSALATAGAQLGLRLGPKDGVSFHIRAEGGVGSLSGFKIHHDADEAVTLSGYYGGMSFAFLWRLPSGVDVGLGWGGRGFGTDDRQVSNACSRSQACLDLDEEPANGLMTFDLHGILRYEL
jgi:hypothetical protein